jgi:hypothetical protein
MWNEFLSGYKMYIIGAAWIVMGILNGDTNEILTGLSVMGLRSALNTVTK